MTCVCVCVCVCVKPAELHQMTAITPPLVVKDFSVTHHHHVTTHMNPARLPLHVTLRRRQTHDNSIL